MFNPRNLLKPVGLLVLSLGLTVLTVIGGAAPLLVLRRAYGRGTFYFGVLSLVAALGAVGMIPYAAILFVVAVIVTALVELTGTGVEFVGRTILASFLGLAGGLLSLLFVARGFGQEVNTFLQAKAAEVMTQVLKVQPDIALDAKGLVEQVPSLILGGAMAAVWVALVFEGVTAKAFQIPKGPTEKELGLLRRFKLPEPMIWLVIFSLALTFFDLGRPALQVAGSNILNVLIFAYFFQGLSIVSSFFRVTKFGAAWQGLWYVLIFFQLFLLVSVLGFADVWLNFRLKMIKNSTVQKHEV